MDCNSDTLSPCASCLEREPAKHCDLQNARLRFGRQSNLRHQDSSPSPGREVSMSPASRRSPTPQQQVCIKHNILARSTAIKGVDDLDWVDQGRLKYHLCRDGCFTILLEQWIAKVMAHHQSGNLPNLSQLNLIQRPPRSPCITFVQYEHVY